jgi:hypothetical protein
MDDTNYPVLPCSQYLWGTQVMLACVMVHANAPLNEVHRSPFHDTDARTLIALILAEQGKWMAIAFIS